MSNRYTKSDAALARLRAVTPGGAQTLSKRAERFTEGSYPVALRAGYGAHVIDVDGHDYLDMICGLASMTLGYGKKNRPLASSEAMPADAVERAVSDQQDRGVTFSLATELEAEAAEKINAMVPCSEMVRFVKTGSEATEAAIRVARKATGRKIILTVKEGYHSWHSWFQSVKPESPGIPYEYGQMVSALPYNDLAAFRDRVEGLRQWDIQVAAIILEPCHYEQPAPGFLQGLRELCNQCGAVLIFDEMVTGFRWANGGAQEYFGVTPDLATFGKACANGYPLAFLCGKADLMQHADVVSGTFGGETLSLAACSAVLDIYQREPVVERLWECGGQFRDMFNMHAVTMGVPAICDGYAVKPRIRFTYGSDRTNTLALSLFVQELARLGVLWHPAGGNLSAAMTRDDIAFAGRSCQEALAIVREAAKDNRWSALTGKPIQPSSFVRGR